MMQTMIEIGDVVVYGYYYTCRVLDVRDGLLKIQPWCNRCVWVSPDDVRVVRKAVR